jgi:hypothetical protein
LPPSSVRPTDVDDALTTELGEHTDRRVEKLVSIESCFFDCLLDDIAKRSLTIEAEQGVSCHWRNVASNTCRVIEHKLRISSHISAILVAKQLTEVVRRDKGDHRFDEVAILDVCCR